MAELAMRVYVIDEHSGVRGNLVRRLSASLGIQVVGDSGDVRVALDELAVLHPDVALVEVKMKQADGVEVCRRVASLDGHLKVVVITTYVDAEERRKVRRAGAAAYFLKDLHTSRLAVRLRTLVEAADESTSLRKYGPEHGPENGPARREGWRPTAEEDGGEEPFPGYLRVLVPLDGSRLSEQVLPCARTVVRHLGSRMELLRIFSPASCDMADPSRGRYLDQIEAGFREQALDYLDGIGQTMADLGLAVSCVAHAGDPASWIINEAEKEPGTLVAMSTHGRSGMTRRTLGSVADKVFHSITAPMLIVCSHDDEASTVETGLDHVIVPLDGSSLAELSLPHVAGLSRAPGLTTILLRVTSLDKEAEAAEYLSKVAGNLREQGLTSIVELVLGGGPADAILGIVHATPKSLVAMTTHGRSGVGRWALGSVTDRVLQHSGGPVLVIRATG